MKVADEVKDGLALLAPVFAGIAGAASLAVPPIPTSRLLVVGAIAIAGTFAAARHIRSMRQIIIATRNQAGGSSGQ